MTTFNITPNWVETKFKKFNSKYFCKKLTIPTKIEVRRMESTFAQVTYTRSILKVVRLEFSSLIACEVAAENALLHEMAHIAEIQLYRETPAHGNRFQEIIKYINDHGEHDVKSFVPNDMPIHQQYVHLSGGEYTYIHRSATVKSDITVNTVVSLEITQLKNKPELLTEYAVNRYGLFSLRSHVR